MRDYNFFSPYIEVKQTKKSGLIPVILIVIIYISFCVSYYFVNMLQISTIEKNIAQIEKFFESKDTQYSLELYEETKIKVQTLNQYREILKDANYRIDSNDKINIALMDSLRLSMPKTIMLSIVTISDESVQLQGIIENRSTLAEYAHNLKQIDIFEAVHVVNMNQNALSDDSYIFTLVCKIGVADSHEIE